MFLNIRQLWRYTILFVTATVLCVACSTPADDITGDWRSLAVGNSPWPGFTAQFIAEEKGFYQAEGITVREKYFQVSTDARKALANGDADVAWIGIPDLVAMADGDPSVRLIAASDYSDGADGILASGVERPEDLLGKTIAWEEQPLQVLLLQSYLRGSDVQIEDLNLRVMPTAQAATALAAGRVDAAVTFEPWLSNAALANGKQIFSSKGTSLIAGGLVGKAPVIEAHREDIAAYLRALEKGFEFYDRDRPAALEIVANKLSVTTDELTPMLNSVRLLKPSEQQSVVFNPNNPLNIIDSIRFATEVGQSLGTISKSLDAAKLYDASYTEDLITEALITEAP